MNQDYTIELAAEHHIRAIPAIEQAAAAIFSESDLPPEVRFLVTDEETLLEAQREKRLWAALLDETKLVGFALARVMGDYAHLEEIDVHPEHGRRGIGSQLLDAVIGWAEAGSLPGITLITFRHLPWNAPFYEQNGFVRLDAESTNGLLQDLIREEAEAGLEPRNRVAMYYDIDTGSD
jgi:GNAT superfamily N-acetyltransferase